MRRMGMCEELGSGIDRVLKVTELFQLPAPDFSVTDGNTRATLFAHRVFAQMGKEERIRAAYQHADLMYVTEKELGTNKDQMLLGRRCVAPPPA